MSVPSPHSVPPAVVPPAVPGSEALTDEPRAASPAPSIEPEAPPVGAWASQSPPSLAEALADVPLADARRAVWGVCPVPADEAEALALLHRPELAAGRTAGLRAGSRRLREVLTVRVLLARMLGGRETEVTYDADGRPGLGPDPALAEAGLSGLDLSVSHTDGYAAVMLSPGRCGIDIERRGRRVARVVSHFLKPEEVALAERQPDPDLTCHLAWSAKEAAYKVLGPAWYNLRRLTTLTDIRWTEGRLTLALDAGPAIPLDGGPEMPLDAGSEMPLAAGPEMPLAAGSEMPLDVRPAAAVMSFRYTADYVLVWWEAT